MEKYINEYQKAELIKELKDKLHRRNMQIKDLKKQLDLRKIIVTCPHCQGQIDTVYYYGF